MKAGEFSGSLSFASAQIAPGVYKLTPNAPLQAGKHAFFPDAKWYAAPVRQRGKLTATVHLFDFGISRDGASRGARAASAYTHC